MWIYFLYSIITVVSCWKDIKLINDSKCLIETQSYPIVKPDSVTFNFYNEDKIKIFQVPKCIFASEMNSILFSEIIPNETEEEYKNRIQRFFKPAVHSDFKAYTNHKNEKKDEHINTFQKQQKHGLDLFEKQGHFYLNATKTRAFTFESNACLFFADSEILFSFSNPCIIRKINMTYTDIYIITSPNFLKITFDDTIIIFGSTDHLIFKAPYRKTDFLFRQTNKDDLLIIGKKDTVLSKHKILANGEFFDEILSKNYEDIKILFKIFNKYAVKYLLSNFCGSINSGYQQIIFLYGLLFYMYSYRNYETLVPLPNIIENHATMLIVRDYMTRCFDLHGYIVYPEFEKMRSFDSFILNYLNQDEKTINTLLKISYLSITYGENLIVSQSEKKNILFVAEQLYEMYISEKKIISENREMFFMLAKIIHTYLIDTQIQKKIIMIMNTLCNPKEILTWSKFLESNNVTISNMLSPCIGSGRRDVNEKFLNVLSKYTNHKLNIQKMNTILNIYNEDFKTLPHVSCLPSYKKLIIIPLLNQTYVISPSYVIKGITHAVTSTILDTNILITAIDIKTPCQKTSFKFKSDTIKSVKNITTQKCEFCESAILEYDDVEGVLSVIYAKGNDELRQITDPKNDFMITNSRTHYLLLSSNGTVYEITSINLQISEFSIILIFVYLIIAGVVLFGIYRMFKLI